MIAVVPNSYDGTAVYIGGDCGYCSCPTGECLRRGNQFQPAVVIHIAPYHSAASNEVVLDVNPRKRVYPPHWIPMELWLAGAPPLPARRPARAHCPAFPRWREHAHHHIPRI